MNACDSGIEMAQKTPPWGGELRRENGARESVGVRQNVIKMKIRMRSDNVSLAEHVTSVAESGMGKSCLPGGMEVSALVFECVIIIIPLRHHTSVLFI